MSPYILDLFIATASKYGLAAHLMIGICGVESGYDPKAINLYDGRDRKHSWGLCQIKYATAREMGMPADKYCERGNLQKCSLLKPDINLEYATKYLLKQLKRYNFDLIKAISAYNAGSYSIKNKAYVRKVLFRGGLR